MVKAEELTQFDGFGNKVQKTSSEHFRSIGFSRSANGITANKYLYNFFSGGQTATYPQESSFANVNSLGFGLGRDIGSTGGNNGYYLYFINNQSELWQSSEGTGTPQMIAKFVNGSYFGAGTSLKVDQKGRLLLAGQRYLGRADPAISDTGFTISVTNGSDTLTSTFGTFTAGMVDQLIRFFVGGTYYYYRLKTYTSGTSMKIYGSVGFATGSYTAIQLTSRTDNWKDFGTSIDFDAEGNTAYFPVETYEDTVLVGRANNVCTLNTLTDTITTDASPAFSLPTGYVIRDIHKGANGILLGANYQRKGVLVLWDNFSDRSIAPWIELPDQLISVTKKDGGWIVVTTRQVFFTNGYSLTPLIDSFLDSSFTAFATNSIPQNSVVIEDDLYIYLGFSANGKRRTGLYKINLVEKTCEHYPRSNMDQYNTTIMSLFYAPLLASGRIYAGTTGSLDYLMYDNEPPIASFISSPMGQGDNFKYAEALKVFLGVSQTDSSKQSPYTFSIIGKICPMEKQMFNLGLVKTTMTDLSTVVVNESTYHIASIGDEIEFLEGESAGYTRNITNISGGGTATATYTLDRPLPVLVSLNKRFFITPFRLIKIKTYTNISEMPEVWFDIKNKPKGKKFMIKIEIEGANVPVELRPSLFIYDDLGEF